MVNIVRRFPVTSALLAITVAFFLLEHALGGGMDPVAHLRLGALWPVRLSEHGEYFRLLMPLLLHAGLVHLLLNGFALLQLGALVEVFWGGRRLVLYYVLCGLGASLSSAVFNTGGPYSVGASGAILGLAGLILGTSWYGESPVRDQLLDLVGRQLLYGVLLTFGLGFGLWLVVPIVDNWAHVGGFATGLLIAGAVPDPTKEDLRRSLAASAAATAAVLASIGWMALEGGRAVAPEGMVGFAREAAAQVSSGPTMASEATLARMTVTFIHAGATEEGLATLGRALDRISEPEEAARVLGMLMYFEGQETRPAFKDALHGGLLLAADRWHELAPDDAHALNGLAWELLQGADAARDPARSVALAREGLERLAPDDDYSRSMVLDTLAEGLFQSGDLEAAEEAQAQAVSLAENAELTLLQRVGLVPSLPKDEMIARLHRIRAAAGQG